MKVVSVVGARPQFIKAAAVSRILRKNNQEILVHTGQHYDKEMSDIFFEELKIPKPDYYLNVGSGNHGEMTGKMLVGVENILLNQKPDCVLVYGDTNSTLAGALAAAKLCIPIIHVEAGLRSFNKAMPEEQNRILTDHISSLFFCPTELSVQNLKAEGIINDVFLVGDVMADSLLFYRDEINERFTSISDLGLTDIFDHTSILPASWILATIHRAENTDSIIKIKEILAALEKADHPVIFPVHPRIFDMVKILHFRNHYHNIHFVQPVGYTAMIYLMLSSEKIVTDSGGVQKEGYILDKPCITVREQTEWMETLEGGYNILAQPDYHDLLSKIKAAKIDRSYEKKDVYGSGNASTKIVTIMEQVYN